jgi:asparagine synthase (glutamine-hydrolysing)
MMHKSKVDHLLTCSIGFTEKQFDESEYAAMVANRMHTDHKTEIVAAGDYDLLDKLVDLYDEPYADSSAIPTYRVCQLARKHVTVALSGDGGDENFIGYRRYKLFAAEERVRQAIPSGVRRAVFGSLGSYYPKLDWAPRVFRGKSTFQALARESSDAYRHAVSICNDDTRSRIFSPEFRRSLGGYSSQEVFDRELCGKTFDDTLRMVQYLDFKTYLPGDILTKVDRASIAHSLEVRVPFLDYRFVEQVAAIPSSEKLRGGEGKSILKRALENHLPHEVLYRKKMGFAVPLEAWFRDSLRDRIASTLRGGPLKDIGFFDSKSLECLIGEHQSGRRNHSAVLWSLLMFDGFLRRSTSS